MERTAAIEILKSLHLPIGAAEKDERDGVVGPYENGRAKRS